MSQHNTFELLYGVMGSGKSAMVAQIYDQYRLAAMESGRRGRALVLTFDPRSPGQLYSRTGLTTPAVMLNAASNAVGTYEACQARESVDIVLVDEAQFCTAAQAVQLAGLVHDFRVDVMCFGLMTAFSGEIFPGAAALISNGITLRPLPISKLCWCRQPAVFNARVIRGEVVTTGPMVLIDGTPGVSYKPLCWLHYYDRQAEPPR